MVKENMVKDENDGISPVRLGVYIVAGIVGIILILSLLFDSWFVVQAGYRGVLFNTFTGVTPLVYDEGFHFKWPFFDTPTYFEVRTRVYKEQAEAASKDLQIVSTEVALNYHISKDAVFSLYQNVGAEYETRIINPAIQETVKSITAKHNAEDLIKERETVKTEIKAHLRERLMTNFISMDELSITNFDFSDEFNAAIEAKVTAEQNALKEQNNLAVVKFQAQQKVEQSLGEAKAIQIVNEELMKSPQYIQYMYAQKWNGVAPLALGSNAFLNIGSGLPQGK